MNNVFKQICTIGWALYLSEGWYTFYNNHHNTKQKRLYAKARSIVLYDRVIVSNLLFSDVVLKGEKSC